MKKFFTLLSAAFAAVALNAQTWDMTAWESADVTSETTIDGLTYHGESKSAYAAGSKTFADGQTWEGRIKFGGGSTCKEGSLSRVFSFDAAKGSVVKVYAVHGSSSGDDRNVFVTQTLTETNRDASVAFGTVATVAAGENPEVLTATVPADGTVYVWADNNVGVYAIKVEAGSGEEPGGEEPGDEPGETPVDPQGEPETYTAISWNGAEYTVSAEFAAVVADPATGGVATNINAEGVSVINFGTANMEAVAVGGTTAKTCDATSVTEWDEIKWDWKNQGDILYAYVNGTGNPVFGYDIEEIMTDGAPTGNYRQNFDGYYYEPDCGKLPAQGLYYKFTAKVDGQVKINVWANKGNRNTYLVDEATTKPVAYTVEGYVNGQNEVIGQDPETGAHISAKKWLSSEEIQFLHDNAKCSKDEDGNIIPGTDSAPYVIGAGNQPFWGQVIYSMKAGQTVYLFHHSAQIGFQGYTFTPNEAGSSISNVEAEAQTVIFNLRGERVSEMTRGQIYIQNGKKVLFR